MASFTSDISEIDVYDIKSSTGLKLSLKRRRRLSNPVNISIQPVEKRQCLTSVSSSDLSVSFQPVLASTWNERALSIQVAVESPIQVEPPYQVEAPGLLDDPTSPVEGQSTHIVPAEDEPFQVTFPNIAQPEWLQQSSQHATSQSDSGNLIDI